MRASVTTLLVALMARALSAEIPTVISYQGKVMDTPGNPVADGPHATVSGDGDD